jgi:hypothetical protein
MMPVVHPSAIVALVWAIAVLLVIVALAMIVIVDLWRTK